MKKSDAKTLELLAGVGRELSSVLKTGLVAVSSNPVFSILIALGATQWLMNHYYNVESGQYDDVWVEERGHWARQPSPVAIMPGVSPTPPAPPYIPIEALPPENPFAPPPTPPYIPIEALPPEDPFAGAPIGGGDWWTLGSGSISGRLGEWIS